MVLQEEIGEWGIGPWDLGTSSADIGALAKKSNDNALSLVFKIANEYCNIINNAEKNNAFSLVMHYFFKNLRGIL